MHHELYARVEQSFPVATVQLRGTLDVDTAPIVRNALRKQLVDQPAALIVDLTDAVLARTSALSVLRSALRSAAEVPGIPLILLAPDPQLRKKLRANALDRQAPIVADRATALDIAAAAEAPLRCILPLLPCATASLREARLAARASCVSWGIGPSGVIVELVSCELVSNAIEHARTSFGITIALRGRYVHIAVRDGDPRPPIRPALRDLADTKGRGLLLVSEFAAAWGHVSERGGKVVWATVPIA